MKKIRTIETLMIITILVLSFQLLSREKSKSENHDIVQEDEFVLEDWMTKPFITDTIKTEN